MMAKIQCVLKPLIYKANFPNRTSTHCLSLSSQVMGS